jgi:hypothetical protein
LALLPTPEPSVVDPPVAAVEPIAADAEIPDNDVKEPASTKAPLSATLLETPEMKKEAAAATDKLPIDITACCPST